MYGINPQTGQIELRGSAVTTPLEAEGTLTKIIPATGATKTLRIQPDLFGIGAPPPLVITVNGSPHTVTYFFAGDTTGDIQIGTYDSETPVYNLDVLDVIAGRLADFLNVANWDIDAEAPAVVDMGAYEFDITTTTTGVAASLSASGTGGPGGSASNGVDESGTRQVELVSAVGGKAHYISDTSYSLGATGWATDAQIGYLYGATFYPCLKIPNANLSANATGEGGEGVSVQSVENLFAPIVGASLIARSSATDTPFDEPTGANLLLSVTYTTR